MCGFLGRIAPLNVYMDQKFFAKALSRLKHRGPDDEGYLLANLETGDAVNCSGEDTTESLKLPPLVAQNGGNFNTVLGFRRLAIMDLSGAAHQPMVSADGTCWLVFNGEIYNYIEIKDELSKDGYRFLSDSDSEVILAAFAKWGAACLHRFVGMWAFAILDVKQSRLFLARDPFGIKPLYYTQAIGGIWFGSEIKALLAVPGVPRRLDPQSLNDYLRHGLTDDSERTMFADM